MADKLDVQVTGKSEAEIAYKLMDDIAKVEGKGFYKNADNPADRDYILKTFAKCMLAVKQPGYYID